MWEISNYNQLISFILSLCLGALFCLVYDVVRAIRRVCLNSFWAVTLGDILLWIFYAIITFIFLIVKTNGELRGYIFICEFFGFILFRVSCSKFVYKIFSFIFIRISFFKRKTETFFGKIYTKIEMLILKISDYIFKILKTIKKLLKNTVKLLYTNKKFSSSETTLNETKTKA